MLVGAFSSIKTIDFATDWIFTPHLRTPSSFNAFFDFLKNHFLELKHRPGPTVLAIGSYANVIWISSSYGLHDRIFKMILSLLRNGKILSKIYF